MGNEYPFCGCDKDQEIKADINLQQKENNNNRKKEFVKYLDESPEKRDNFILIENENKEEKRKKELDEREEILKKKEADLIERNQKFENETQLKIEELNNKEKDLNEQKTKLKNIQEELDLLDKKLEEGNKKLEEERNKQKQDIINEKEKIRKEKENIEKNLEERETDIETKITDIKSRENKLKESIKKNKDKEKNIKKILTEKEKELKDKYDKIEKDLKNKEKDIDEKNQKLIEKKEESELIEQKIKEQKKDFELKRKELDKDLKDFELKKKEFDKNLKNFELKKKELDKNLKDSRNSKNKELEKKKDIDEKEKIFNKKENELKEKENNIKLNEKQIKLKETQLNQLYEKFELEKKKHKEEYEKHNNELLEREKAIENKEIELIESKKPILIGLNNIGATCYMNATLQCLSNTKKLTEYFLNIYKISPNKNMSNEYYKVLTNIWDRKINNKSYSPNSFKEVLSKENPLFAGIAANDSKDLINFLLERFHQELNVEKSNKNINNNDMIAQEDQTNEPSMLKIFLEEFQQKFNSPISNLFYGIIETKSQCLGCKIIKYNFQVYSFLEFPLQQVNEYFYKLGKKPLYTMNGQNPDVNLYECFEYYSKVDLMNGENQMYCNICNKLFDSFYSTVIYSTPIYLIINLNRGKGATYQCKVNFPDQLNLYNNVTFKDGYTVYGLYAVICHLGPSSMSGHFVAYCRNRNDNKWYLYNDAFVNPCTKPQQYNDGMPYILFYKALTIE